MARRCRSRLRRTPILCDSEASPRSQGADARSLGARGARICRPLAWRRAVRGWRHRLVRRAGHRAGSGLGGGRFCEAERGRARAGLEERCTGAQRCTRRQRRRKRTEHAVRSVPEGRDRQCAKADSSGGGAGGARSEGDEVSGKGERAVGSERGRQRVRDGGERDGGSPAALKTRAQHFSALHPEGKREYTPQRAAEGKSDGLAQRHGVQFMARTRRRASGSGAVRKPRDDEGRAFA